MSFSIPLLPVRSGPAAISLSGGHSPTEITSLPPGLTTTFVRENLRFVETYEAVLEALGDRTRRQIVHRLRAGPSSVGELAAALPVSRPAVSQHLTVLRRCGLVRYEELGTRNVYRLDPAGLSELRAWLDDFWEAALDRYAQRVRDDSAGRGPQPPHA